MKNADYWRGRFAILENSAHKQADEYLQTLEDIYREAEQSVQRDIESWYQRFATNNKVTLAEARKMLTTGQLEEFKWTAEQYVKAAQRANLSEDWIKKLENASTRFHVSRLEAIQLQIQQEMELLFGNQVDGIDDLLKDVVSNGYTRGAFEVQKGIGLGWDFTALNQKKLETLLSKPWTTDGRTFRDRCWTNKADLVDTVNKELIQGMLRGDPPAKIITAIQKKFGTSRYKARRLVHTETTYFNAVSKTQMYKDLGVEQIEIVETLDSRTCLICQPLDGKVIPLSQYEPGVTVPPFHPNCRGTTCPYYDDMEGERAARNADGKVYYVPANMTFTQWKKAFVDGVKDGLTASLTAEVYEKLRSSARAKQSELDTASKELSQLHMEQRLANFGGDTVKVQKLNEREAALQEKIKGLQADLEKLFKDANIDSEIGKALFTSSVDRLQVQTLEKSLTPEEIISKLGGGDQTKGSCSSLGFAFAGNHNGWNVTDFRGGASQEFFSKSSNILSIARLPGVSSVIENSYNDIAGATKLLKTMAEDKLYYLATGRHAAIVRKLASGGYEYLELQTVNSNGFHTLTQDVLRRRFGCQRSHTFYGKKFACNNILIDIDSLNGNKEFENILGYLNTQADKQMKGVAGYAK